MLEQKIANSSQQSAIEASVARHCLVSAPPGTGKTDVLIRRVHYLLEHGYTSQNILALTFSTRTVQDLKARLVEADLPVQARTFHSFANRVLRDNAEELRLNPDFEIIEKYEQQAIIKEILDKLKTDKQLFGVEQVQNYINESKQRAFEPAAIPTRESLNAFTEGLKTIHRHYDAYCQQSGLMDFTELLIAVCELLDKHPSVLAKYQEQYPHILVDEYHDVEPLQVALLQRLTRNNKAHLYALADKYQTIYGFRGSDLEYTIDFAEYFEKPLTFQLTDSYRSGQPILNVANAIVSNCQLTHETIEQIPQLHSALSQDYNNPVYLYEGQTDTQEAHYVVEQIKQYIESPKNWTEDLSQIAVLYRANMQSEAIENALKAQNIEYQKPSEKAKDFYNSVEVKDVLAYLRFIDNHDNNHALKRILNKPSRRIGKETQQVLQLIMNENQVTLWESLRLVTEQSAKFSRSIKYTSALQNFVTLTDNLQHRESESLSKYIERVIKQSGLHKYYQQRQNREQLHNLNKLVQIAKSYEMNNAVSTLSNFISYITLESEAQNGIRQAVQLMTLHTSKGLQFEIVFIIGLQENRLPIKRAIERGLEAIEEERRLFYVGVTRARRHLYLSYSRSSNLTGNRFINNEMSRFLKEIPQHLLNVRTSKQNVLHSFSETSALSQKFMVNDSCDNELCLAGQWLNAKRVSERFNITERGAQKALKNAFEKNMAWRSVYLNVRMNERTKAYEVHKDSLPRMPGEPPFRFISNEKKSLELNELQAIRESTVLKSEIVAPSCQGNIVQVNTDACTISDIFPIHKKDVMVDWATINQEFDHDLPPLNDGQIKCFDSEGNEEWTTVKRLQYEGSHSSKVAIWTKGKTLYASGNFGRFDRQENILNYNLSDTIKILNHILDRREFAHLPKFSVGQFEIGNKRTETRHGVFTKSFRSYTGAHLTRLDSMRNYEFDTEQLKKDWLYYAANTHLPYQRTSHYGKVSQVEAVYWGEGSKFYTIKAYDKGSEFAYQYKDKIIKDSYLKQCYEYLMDCNIIRIELSLKGQLSTLGLNSLGMLMNTREKIIDYETEVFYSKPLSEFFEDKTKPLLTDTDKANAETLKSVDKSSHTVYLCWMMGERMAGRYKERTMKKHLKNIQSVMGAWADIRRPPPKRPFDGVIRIAMPRLAEPPKEFYQMAPVNKRA